MDGPRSIRKEPSGWLARRAEQYWGIENGRLDDFEQLLQCDAYHAAIAVGVEALPFLRASQTRCESGTPRDDPVLHYWTLARREGVRLRSLKYVVSMVLFEYCYRSAIDSAWVVSERDRRWLGGVLRKQRVHVIPNGSMLSIFAPHRNRNGEMPVRLGEIGFSA